MTKELSDEEKKQKIVNNIRKNYRQVEMSIVNQLFMKHDLHGTTIGSERESIWGQLFEMIVPKKFVIEPSVFIIDSEGRVSHEVDFAIMDEMYTPYIFRYGKVKFVPIEAVAAVVECKSQNVDEAQIKRWVESMNQLRTSGESVARMAHKIARGATPTQQSTRPIRILCALQDTCSDGLKKHFDFTLLASYKKENQSDGRIEIHLNPQKAQSSLKDWYKELNFHNVDQKINFEGIGELEKISLDDFRVQNENGMVISLLTFNFQLNQLLMLINNPILFPHRAYAKLFNYPGEEGNNGEIRSSRID
ncbi:DUF6602 domain-containing protein [Paenibacillus phoenicis]|uniref:DUF6602 domain-containing protein n=1 Tax=Paenibacillus phoenicis TaxID=554117 RepID=A0ABU5PP79_9BACL|nr:DUF6602 domain-containing protein [Paenibacillus phoenicis]MEA3571632.1 DUF6602 domain-containing protein [Paenibacillus phoenicis]